MKIFFLLLLFLAVNAYIPREDLLPLYGPDQNPKDGIHKVTLSPDGNYVAYIAL